MRTHGGKCQNLGLWLDRFILYERRGNQWEQSQQSKRREAAPLNLQRLNQLLTACSRRWEAMLKSYEPDVVQFTAEPEWRVVIGLGSGHVLETNITLHRIYGVPFIPASAVKGVTRAQAFWEIAEKLGVPSVSDDEAEWRGKAKRKTPLQLLNQLLSEGSVKEQTETLEQLQGDELCRDVAAVQSLNLDQWHALAGDFYAVFGTTKRQGKVIFFDAYPAQAPRMKLDVMNPHYADYYQQRVDKTGRPTPPADYLSPVPVYFLTVERTPFAFALASRDSHLRQTAEAWLRTALSNLGIGSKTAAGYGFFSSTQG
ncbi:MAG TPA: type III-B CRISPR module RAMP protein Cmr6 [Blastocatellia bacterium]|nr:type III-B CRISPR module RAMP protein Cmr6 [Blastocatellia bacterium]